MVMLLGMVVALVNVNDADGSGDGGDGVVNGEMIIAIELD